MQWHDQAIIVGLHKYNENSALVKALTAEHGLCSGMVKISSKSASVYLVGNLVEISWSARLPEHLGSFRAELLKSVYSVIYNDKLRILALGSMCELVSASLTEKNKESEVFEEMMNFISALRNDKDILKHYALLEFALLYAMGFGIDLSSCAATGSTDLSTFSYVSPRSGQAVSLEAGLPYHDKLLPLPTFLLDKSLEASTKEVMDALKLTGYFLNKYSSSIHNYPVTQARSRFLEGVLVGV
jgi:DNA repair protein RecO (recombination protein O)